VDIPGLLHPIDDRLGFSFDAGQLTIQLVYQPEPGSTIEA
jgi:hypothetical protein